MTTRRERHLEGVYDAEYHSALEEAAYGRSWLDRGVAIPAYGAGRQEALGRLLGRALHMLEHAEAALAAEAPQSVHPQEHLDYLRRLEEAATGLRATRDALRYLASVG
jgi:hypothetical protein